MGLRLAGTVGALAVVLIALGIYAVQVFVSAVWLARFRYGPVEWRLRMWTEKRRIPLRSFTNR